MIKAVETVQFALLTTFQEVNAWFDQDGKVRAYRPQDGGWTIDEILEHIALTNHYLLILIDKGKRKALKRKGEVDLNSMLNDYAFNSEKLVNIGNHQSFWCVRPEHMEPQGGKDSTEVKSTIKEQARQCIEVLQDLSSGEGILYKTTMSVDNLGKLDVYEYIYFLAQHARRHVAQMRSNKREYLNNENYGSK